MAFIFKVAETVVDSQTWLVLLGNGRYFASTGSAAPSSWSAADEALPEGETWALGSQFIQAWESPSNIATNGSGTYATNKPAGASPGDGKQYVYNTGEDPPAGNWNGIEAGAFRAVAFDDANSRFVRVNQNTMQGRTHMAFSNDGVNYGSTHRMLNGVYQIHHMAIHNSVFVGVYQLNSSDPSGLKGNRIYINSGSDYPENDTYEANITHSSGESRISRPAYGNGTWLAGYTSGVLKSTDGGENWTPTTISHGGTACRIQANAYSSGTGTWIAAGTVGTDVNNGTAIILRSIDGGATWSTVKTGGIANGGFLSVASSNDRVWLVGGQNREVYRSIDDGLNWVGPIDKIYDDTFDGNNSHYDVVSILYEENHNV
jgi:photosystem II stability/assembly factor-like uncharacterized protein